MTLAQKYARTPLNAAKTIRRHTFHKDNIMMTLAIVLLVLWGLGMVSAYTIGGLIHVLLVVAVVVMLVRLIQGRRPINI